MDNLAIKCYKMLKDSYSNEYSEIMEMFYGISFSELISKNTNKAISIVPESYKWYILINPLTSMIELFRFIFLNSDDLNLNNCIYSFIISLVLFFLGLIIFNRIEKTFVDTL